MKRAGAILIMGCGIALAAAPRAAAQLPITFAVGASPADTGSALAPGATATIPIRYHFPNAVYSYYGYGYAVRGIQLTVHFDPARVEVLAAQSNTYELNVTGSPAGAGAFTVNASYSYAYAGVYGQDVVPLRITARLLPGASDGAYLWIEPGPATACYQSYYYWNCNGSYALNGLSRIGQVCHATQVWGDVDGNGQVESRDALITLSAAVGLAVSGFDLVHGDVDDDGLTNSRDALMMLSYAIALPIYQTNRVGVGIADACPAPSAPGETVVFKRTGTGAGLYRLDSTATTPVALPGSNGLDDYPRLNATGTDVVFECDSVGATRICRSDQTGAGRRYLPGPFGPGRSEFPDWSPDGGEIAYLYIGYLSLMDSAGGGSGPHGGFFAGGSPARGVGWSRDAALLAFSNMSIGPFSPEPGIKAVLLSNISETLLISAVSDGDQVRWSPDGADVLFSRSDWSIWSVSATGGTPQRLVAFQGGSRAFDVGPQGLLFTATGPGGDNAVWLLTGGSSGPVVRLTSPPAGSGDVNPSFRRNP